MRVGDLVERAGATIRGPNGEKKTLEEAEHYGIVIALNPLDSDSSDWNGYVRVMWFDKMGNSTSTTIVSPDQLLKISK